MKDKSRIEKKKRCTNACFRLSLFAIKAPLCSPLMTQICLNCKSVLQEYDQCISKVRSFLSSNARSLTTLRECDRLLSAARRCATSMEQLAEESGDPFKINVSKRRVSEDIAPLLAEVGRATQERENGDYVHQQNQRSELFSGYRAPTLNGDSGEGNGDTDDMEMLIRNSDDLLRESQALCAETEETGAETLGLMGRQREQLQNASNHLSGAQAYITEAKDILQAM